MAAGCTGRPKRWGESPCRAQQLQHGRVRGLCDPALCQIPMFIPQSPHLGREEGLEGVQVQSQLPVHLPRLGRAASPVLHYGCGQEAAGGHWEHPGGRVMVVVVHHRWLVPVCSQGQGSSKLQVLGGERQRMSAESCDFRFHSMLRAHSLQCIPLVSVREMQNDRMTCTGRRASEHAPPLSPSLRCSVLHSPLALPALCVLCPGLVPSQGDEPLPGVPLRLGCCYLLRGLEQGRAASPELCQWHSLQHHVLHHHLVHLSILHQHHLHHVWAEKERGVF